MLAGAGWGWLGLAGAGLGWLELVATAPKRSGFLVTSFLTSEFEIRNFVFQFFFEALSMYMAPGSVMNRFLRCCTSFNLFSSDVGVEWTISFEWNFARMSNA